MTLICDVCGQIEYSPFEDGDKCICGGRFHGIEWYRSRLTLALSRIEAAEKMLKHCQKCPYVGAMKTCDTCTSNIKYTASIRAMEGKK